MQNKLELHRKLKVVSKTSFVIGTLAFLLVVFELGFSYEQTWQKAVYLFFNIALFTGFLSLLLRTITKANSYSKTALFTDIIFIFILSVAIVYNITRLLITGSVSELNNSWTYIGLLIVFFREIYNLPFYFLYKVSNPALIFVTSFIATIFIGSLFLMLPNATSNSNITFVDALFTSTSAVCVTGLSVQDTQFFFTRFGQIIIMSLIQIGGLGIMTFATYFNRFFTGRASFDAQFFVAQTTAVDNFNNAFRTIRNIILITFGTEIIGAMFMFFSTNVSAESDTGEHLFFSIFHAVSSFCNAGFSTFSNNYYDVSLRFNYPFLLTSAFLIIFGGLGFPILFNLSKYIWYKIDSNFKKIFLNEPKRYKTWMMNLDTKVVLSSTSILLIGGTFLFFIFEYNNTLVEHKTLLGKLVTAFFGAVTPRTAGFNSVNISQMLIPTTLLTIFLMWIGASPASTAGGIKNSTLVVAVLNAVSLVRKRPANLFGRQIDQSSLHKASAIILLSLFVIGISTFTIMLIEPEKGLLNVGFEVVSAYGTVGLSRGLTPSLTNASKVVLIITMFLGRVTMYTFLMSFFKPKPQVNYQYPTEDLLIN